MRTTQPVAGFPLFVLAATVTLCAVKAALPPEAGAWTRGLKPEPLSPGTDRIFLLNRGWVSGRVTKIDAGNVTIQEVGGQPQSFSRPEVSLIQLSDWMIPEKRQDKQELKLRIECEGAADTAVVLFPRGTIIRKVDAPPRFESGGDTDDKAQTEITSISLSKGSDDRSITKMTTDVTLLIPTANELLCEVEARRANGQTGPLMVRFSDPANGRELVALKRPASEMWSIVKVPLQKLRPGQSASKVDCIGCSEVVSKRVDLLPPAKAPPQPNDNTESRVILMDYQTGSGRVLELNNDCLMLQSGHSPKPLAIPRWKISTIELNEWEAPWRNIRTGDKPSLELTPPLVLTFAGSSSGGGWELQGEDSIAQLLVPPHYISGWDRDDSASVQNERSITFTKQGMDRSSFQIEATVVLRVTNPRTVELKISNRFTNVLAGDLKVVLLNALNKKLIAASGLETQKTLDSVLKVPRTKLIDP